MWKGVGRQVGVRSVNGGVRRYGISNRLVNKMLQEMVKFFQVLSYQVLRPSDYDVLS